MKKHIFLAVVFLVVVIGLVLSIVIYSNAAVPEINFAGSIKLVNFPRIFPDYSNVTIPNNIAPLHFYIKEIGKYFVAKIYIDDGRQIKIYSESPKIKIPMKKWCDLINVKTDSQLYLEIYVLKKNNKLYQYETIINHIVPYPVDGYVLYRKLKPNYNFWRNIGIFQRDLSNFDERVILHGKYFSINNRSCLNCHTPLNNNPEKLLMGIRSPEHGASTLIVENNEVRKIGSKFGYMSWHPGGKVAVYSINLVNQFFHTSRMEDRDVIDLDSSMAYYSTELRNIKMAPFSEKDRLETYPCWSPDGKYLYFCSAPFLWDRKTKEFPPENYDKLQYDLLRVSYDLESDKWGEVENVLLAKDTGKNIMLPRISPDGKFMIFCMCNYGCFPVYQPSSDLYIMDMQTLEYKKLDINSPYSESWHSWSRNSRWLVFSSKKLGGLFTRLFVSYIDEKGKGYKPFVLPQKDPAHYDSYLFTYNTPEFIIKPVQLNQLAFLNAIRSKEAIVVDSITKATPKTPKEQKRSKLREHQ